DSDCWGARALYFAAHVVQHVGEIDDFRLASRVLKDGTAVSQHRCHHQVFGARYCDLVEEDFRSSETLSHGFDITMLSTNACAEFLESLDVKIYRPRSNRASSRQRDSRMPGTRKKRTQDKN